MNFDTAFLMRLHQIICTRVFVTVTFNFTFLSRTLSSLFYDKKLLKFYLIQYNLLNFTHIIIKNSFLNKIKSYISDIIYH